MKRTIEIKLAKQQVGTTGKVITKRIFRKPTTDVYVCVEWNPIAGAIWRNLSTFENADTELNYDLTDAAQKQVQNNLAEAIPAAIKIIDINRLILDSMQQKITQLRGILKS